MMLKRRLKVNWTSFNNRHVTAVREYRECEVAKESNLSDEKAKRKEVREKRNKYKKG